MTEAIRFDRVSKTYILGVRRRPRPALFDLDMGVGLGEVFGFIGPNGAGKSTAIKILLNFLRPTSGTAYILGKQARDFTSRERIGFLPENPQLYDHLSGEELLDFGLSISGRTFADRSKRVSSWLARLGLEDAAKKRIRTYSKGMVQRLGIALALVHDPEIVILDEPMSGLDPVGRKIVADVIVELKRAGKTVFFSSHILNDVERLTDRVGVLVKGRLVMLGPSTEMAGGGDLEARFMALVKAHDPESVAFVEGAAPS